VEPLTQWLVDGPTPVMWVSGPAGAGETTPVARAVRRHRAAVIRLGAFDPDRAVAEAAGVHQDDRLTTAALFRFVTSQRVVVLDGLDRIQQHGGVSQADIVDCRFRQLLLAACDRTLPATRIIVTSRLRPPTVIPADSITLLELAEAQDAESSPPQEDPSDPERRLERLVNGGDLDKAVQVYWRDLGNFSRLHDEGRDHLGARLCRRLNDGRAPDDVSPALIASGSAPVVLNDWSQFAVCCGDAVTSALAADAAYRLSGDDQPPWSAAMLAVHAAQACALSGRLFDAMRWCERSWEHARLGMRRTQGFAGREVMEAYDWSANTIAKIYLRLDAPTEIRRLIDDLLVIHERARESISEFNEGSVIPVSGPSGEVTADDLCDGRLAAILALAEGDFPKVAALAAAHTDAIAGNELGVLLLRAKLADGSDDEADALLARLRRSAENEDDCASECELAVLAQTRIDDANARLALANTYLPRSAACGLGLHWRDLQLWRARALRDLGHNEEACRAADSALLGHGSMTGAYPTGDWSAARDAASLLGSLGRPAPDKIIDALEHAAPPPRISPTRPVKRRTSAAKKQESSGREGMHDAAVRVLDAYESDGTPFVLYFRHFGMEVLHGPFEHGPKLTENALRDALPSDVEVITIQDQSSFFRDLGTSRFRRDAPALALGDDAWVDVVRQLIPFADVIVSEPLQLSSGVRLELQMIYAARRWDRTVLVLPPLESLVSTIDSDDIVQMFPRCVWADSLHDEPLTASPIITDLMERVAGIARLPAKKRRELRDPGARDQAFPVDLGRAAEYLENEARLSSIFHGDDARTRYYAFWQMFRAAAIRFIEFERGDRSPTNRCRIAHAYLEMSAIMLDYDSEGDRYVLQGDPAEAQLLVGSAFALLEDIEERDLWARALRAQAEHRSEELSKLERIMAANPDRFEIRVRYGPLVKRKVERKTLGE